METPNINQSYYEKTYSSFSGADITASIGNYLIGELQSITYSVTREKAPVFTMGNPNPRSFSRGKRGIAGSLVFTVFDRDALYDVKQATDVARQGFNDSAFGTYSGDENTPINVPHQNMSAETNRERWTQWSRPHYSDEIPPFDVTISMLNEYGHSSEMRIYGIEILNEGMGMSIDDITTQKSCSFVARGMDDMRANKYEGNDGRVQQTGRGHAGRGRV